jgi:hypothetical protein
MVPKLFFQDHLKVAADLLDAKDKNKEVLLI